MSSPEAVELRQRTDDELQGELETAHQALFNLRFQAATRQLADVKQVKRARRQVARIKTLMRERSIIAEVDAEAATVVEGSAAGTPAAADATVSSDAADAAVSSDAADAAGEEE